jgi:Cdc6-like AAA superfamily ATPase
MSNSINSAIFKIAKRAEKHEKEHLLKTFVNVGPLLTLLTNVDHQILYGRRGTGKTHALNYLKAEIENKGHLSVYVNMPNLGSNGGIYSDFSLPITERATRLLIDTFSVIHDQILDVVLEFDDQYDLSQFGPILDELAQAIKEIEVVGTVEIEETENSRNIDNAESNIGFSIKDLSVSSKQWESTENQSSKRQKTSGNVRHRVHFTTIHSVFMKLRKLLGKKELWLLIDEWAEVPLDLQPYLADLLRRSLFSIQGITVKIAAIEKRTNFKLDNNGSYIGVETGADISAGLNLDEFMVFDNDEQKSIGFFKSLIYNHINQIMLESGGGLLSPNELINEGFTQIGAFEELVKASEGIPRDAINILVHSALKAGSDKISIPHIRYAARQWYNTDKEKAISGRPSSKKLLRWIIDEVIGSKKNRAFLLSSDVEDDDIEYLYDNRLLHIIKQNISSKDKPGERYNVYQLDFGTYVHLINTIDQPRTLFSVENEIGEEIEVIVPTNDYRSIRRSILDIEKYYLNSSQTTLFNYH